MKGLFLKYYSIFFNSLYVKLCHVVEKVKTLSWVEENRNE